MDLNETISGIRARCDICVAEQKGMYFDAAVEHGIDEVLALLDEPEREYVMDSLTAFSCDIYA